MNGSDHLQERAYELVGAARAFHAAAQRPGSRVRVPHVLESLEEAFQVLSGAWYQLAADASPGIVERRRGHDADAASSPRVNGFSREERVRLMGSLHDVAAALARCARACRDGRSTAPPVLAEGTAPDDRRHHHPFPRFQRRDRSTERVA